ncbi:hypothetical protein [Actinomadura parmotrematis]|uniref:ABC transporter permease n=1 Tax=Actinomadura parmotrematis TaxID=2864039 RepID=A0ABS7FTX3_9ACTN|nr:hypothetical protein [Actinomadura parmotrematis]MBW8483860.1 hypothetical protein [Actinomadura parmotrematis]
MSELGRVLRLEARRTALLVAVPALAGAGVVAAWLSLPPGVAYWDNSVVALMNSVLLLGPVGAGLACWTAVRKRHLDYLRDLTTRSPSTAALLDLLLLTAGALVAYTAVTVVVATQALVRAQAGPVHPLGVPAGASALVLFVVAGYFAGRALPRAVTPVLVLALAWPWAMLRAPDGSRLSLLPPAAFGRIELFTGLRPQVLLDQTLCAAGLALTLTLGYVGWTNRRLLTVLPLSLALAAAVYGTVRLVGADDPAVQPAPVRPACREWPLTVCVHPALRGALPSLSAAAVPLAARLNGTPGAFTRVEQRPPGEAPRVLDGVATVHLDDVLAPGFESRAVRQIRDGLVGGRMCPTTAAAQYRGLVDAWLLGENPPAVADARTARRFTGWSEDRRRGWLRAHFASYRDCALRPGTFADPAAKAAGKTENTAKKPVKKAARKGKHKRPARSSSA